jgi:hypothetical protein
MSFDRPRGAIIPVDKPASSHQRVAFLEVLGQVLRGTDGVSAGLVPREGRTVLFVVSGSPALRRTEIACELTSNGWWFSWAGDGRMLAPAQDAKSAAEAIIGYLHGTGTV